MNIFEDLANQYMLPNQMKLIRENVKQKPTLNEKIAVAWWSCVAPGVSGQCCLLAAAWLAAEVGHWVKREEFKQQYNHDETAKLLGNHESWILPIIEAWMK